jgi:hypothetical protein
MTKDMLINFLFQFKESEMKDSKLQFHILKLLSIQLVKFNED